jgi:hypothetical protein
MGTEVINHETLPAAGNERDDFARPGLTSMPDALSVIFDRIEQAVTADRRNAAFSAPPRRLRIVTR